MMNCTAGNLSPGFVGYEISFKKRTTSCLFPFFSRLYVS